VILPLLVFPDLSLHKHCFDRYFVTKTRFCYRPAMATSTTGLTTTLYPLRRHCRTKRGSLIILSTPRFVSLGTKIRLRRSKYLETVFFCGYAGSGSGQSRSGQIQNIESLRRLYSVCWGGNKWPRRILGGELQCGGLQPLCEGLLGGSSVEEGVGQPAGVP
jgi:hypothetical protein